MGSLDLIILTFILVTVDYFSLAKSYSDNIEQVPKVEQEKLQKRGDIVIGDIIFPKSSISPSSGLVNKEWPDGIVPYIIHSSVSNKPEWKKIVELGISELNLQTCVTLRPATSIDSGYILITAQNSGCYSVMGYTGKEQVVNLGTGCYRKGTVVHEISHALGFFHEHSRNDRDSFVQINYDNVLSGREINFRKTSELTGEQVSFYGVSYNYESVMHYSPTAFTNSANAITIQSLNNHGGIGNPNKMGQRAGLSLGDVNMINQKYKLSSKCNKNEK